MGYIKLIRRSAEQKLVVAPVPQPVPEQSAPARLYPDGEVIPATLPALYAPANPNPAPGEIIKRCDNCAAWMPETRYCRTWNAVVRPEYVCAVWQAVA